MGCNCGKNRSKKIGGQIGGQIPSQPQPAPPAPVEPAPAPAAAGTYQLVLTASGTPLRYSSRLEAEAARVRNGGQGTVLPV
jgi:hypothetical protein